MPGPRGRKPLSPLGKRKQVSLTLSPEEVVFLADWWEKPTQGIRALIRQAVAGEIDPFAMNEKGELQRISVTAAE